MYFSALLVSLLAAVAVHGYPTGAPSTVCKSMMPGHGVPPQSNPSPYDIILEKSKLQGGQSMEVTIKGKNGVTFRGYFIQARTEATGDKPVGEFSVSDSIGKLVNCGEGKKNAVSHSDPSDKKEATVTWLAPKDLEGKEVFFYVTIVKVFDTFWVKEKSTPLFTN